MDVAVCWMLFLARLPCNDTTCAYTLRTDGSREGGIYDYPCTPDAQHQEGAIQMTENPAYAAITDHYNVEKVF